MIQLLSGLALFIYCIYSFCREVNQDRSRRIERERLGDEHILREIEQFYARKGISPTNGAVK